MFRQRVGTAGGSFSRKRKKVVRARPELGGNVVQSNKLQQSQYFSQ